MENVKMNDEPKVSVIVPVYNAEKYIARCLNSLINQSYRNLEIILVDDGSTDGSSQICRDYADRDRRIKVHCQNNAGQGTARNTGIDIATGDYISFVDADDYIALYMYEKIINIFWEKKVDIVCFDLAMGNDDNFLFAAKEFETELYEGKDFLRNLYRIRNFDSSVLKVYSKSVFANVRFPEGRTMGEDVGTVYKLIYNAKKIAKCKAEMYYYYQSSNSTMRGRFSIEKMGECYSFKERLLFFKNIDEIALFDRALLQYEAVVLKNLFYVRKLYAQNRENITWLQEELAYVQEQIKISRNIGNIKKIVYCLAAHMPTISGLLISRVI